MKTPQSHANITAHLLAIKQALATSPSTLPMRNAGVRIIPAYVPFRHCENIFIKLREQREVAIAELSSNATHLTPDAQTRYSIQYDTTIAPLSTNRKMMDMIGITISPTDTGWTTLCMIIHGLAAWDIFITESNHLNDEEFLLALQHAIDTPVRLVPPGNGNPEWISMAGYCAESYSNPICDRKMFLPAPILKAGANYQAVQL